MKRLAILLALAAAMSAIELARISDVHAQPAFALGKPLPDSKLPTGTVSVRVVAGSAASPVAGTDVTLLVGGEPRVARTDSQGRASFSGLAPGATVQARIADAEGKPVVSDSFPVGGGGGIRVMLTTKPFAESAGMPGMGPQGMPEPRKISGQPRQDREEPPAQYSVRLTYNNLKQVDGKMHDDAPPVSETVTLVGYTADDAVTVATAQTDADGRAVFKELDPSGGTVYFALATLPRNGGHDRMKALPIQVDGQAGMRVVLSAEKRDSKEPFVDDLAAPQTIPTPAGKVRVSLEGFPEGADGVTLRDAATGARLGQALPVVPPPDPNQVQGGAQFDADKDLPAGAVQFQIHGGPGKTDEPLRDVPIKVVPATAPSASEGVTANTGSDGTLRLLVPVTGPQKAVLVINGKEFTTDPFDVSKTGGRLEMVARWGIESRPQAQFDVAYRRGLTVYAETRIATGRLTGNYRSAPFQLVEHTGTHVGILVIPRVMFRFSFRAIVEDQHFAVQGRWTIDNNSWSPFRASPDGILIPAPRGFKGGIVAGMNQNEVAVVPGEGFRVMRPIPPGGRNFIAGFSLPVEDGEASWAWDLPYGAFQSGMEIRQTGGLKVVDLPASSEAETRFDQNGNPWFVIDNVAIGPNKSMVMRVVGLPAQAAWKVLVPLIAGILVLLTMLAGVGFALFGGRSAAALSDVGRVRRAALLDELVELERSGKDPRRREQVMSELERLWPGNA